MAQGMHDCYSSDPEAEQKQLNLIPPLYSRDGIVAGGSMTRIVRKRHLLTGTNTMKPPDLAARRHEMVEHQIRARGVRDPLVLKALGHVPREAFLPEKMWECAYEDSPLPIAAGQTISQPYIVAFMIEALALEGGERVLEIGTGSGYAAAVLGEIAAEVYTVERIEELADNATAALKSLNYCNVYVHCGDGTLGLPEHAPYDAIVVAAGGPSVPESLQSQLKLGGRMVIPVGSEPTSQELVRITRESEARFTSEHIADVRFVPLIGDEAWQVESHAKTATGQRLPTRIQKKNAVISDLVVDASEPVDDPFRTPWIRPAR